VKIRVSGASLAVHLILTNEAGDWIKCPRACFDCRGGERADVTDFIWSIEASVLLLHARASGVVGRNESTHPLFVSTQPSAFNKATLLNLL
jgi:hypothetical protein